MITFYEEMTVYGDDKDWNGDLSLREFKSTHQILHYCDELMHDICHEVDVAGDNLAIEVERKETVCEQSRQPDSVGDQTFFKMHV